MTTIAAHGLAPTFTHTSAAPDVTMTFAAGASPVTASLTTGTYRMWLAPSASCYLRALVAAIQAAVTAARGAGTVTVALDAAGIATITFTDKPAVLTLAATVWKRLGYATATPSTALGAVTGVRPVWHLALLTAATGPYWQPLQAGGAEQTTGGLVYAIAATTTSWSRKLNVHLQPTTPTLRTAHGCDATAMYPAEEYMASLGAIDVAREWSVLDVLYSARNALCGYTGTWATARTSTSERTWRVYVGQATLLSPSLTLTKPEWLAYSEWDLALVAPSTSPTETRA